MNGYLGSESARREEPPCPIGLALAGAGGVDGGVGGLDSGQALFADAEHARDLAHIALGLFVGRHAAMPAHGLFAGVVAGQGQTQVAVEVVEQPAQIGHAAVDVLTCVPGVGDAEAACGVGDELHQALGLFVGLGLGVEVGFDLDDGEDDVGVESMAWGEGSDQAFDLAAVGGVECESGDGGGGWFGFGRFGGLGRAGGWQGAGDHVFAGDAVGVGGEAGRAEIPVLEPGLGGAVLAGGGFQQPGGGQDFVTFSEQGACIDVTQTILCLGVAESGGGAIELDGTVDVLGGAHAVEVALTPVEQDGGVVGVQRIV